MPASAILPLPTTVSSYWSPLGRLRTLPPSPPRGPAGAARAGAVVAGAVVAGAGDAAALVVVEVAAEEGDESVLVVVSLHPTASTAARRARVVMCLGIRDLLARAAGSFSSRANSH